MSRNALLKTGTMFESKVTAMRLEPKIALFLNKHLIICAIHPMIDLNYEYLSLRGIWLYVLAMSRTGFRVNSHSMFASMSGNSILKTGVMSEV